MQKFASIQYLRGLAACLVVCVHVQSAGALGGNGPGWDAIGGSGVDIFFVISGFIMWTLTASRETTPYEFMSRRLIRIIPLYWAFTLLLVGSFLAFPSAFRTLSFSATELASSLAFIPFTNSTNGTTRPVLQQGWTLNFEMLFYLIMTIALFFHRSKRAVLVVGTLLVLPAVGLLMSPQSVVGRYWTDPMLIEFVGGICIAALLASNRLPNPVLAIALILTACVGYMIASLYAGPDGPPLRMVTWGIPSALLVLGMVALEQKTAFLQSAALLLIGDASYSIYLSHSFTISITKKLYGVSGGGAPLQSGWSTFAVVVTVCVVAGIAVYKAFELPFLKYSTRVLTGPRKPPRLTIDLAKGAKTT